MLSFVKVETCKNLQKPAIQSARIGLYEPESLLDRIKPRYGLTLNSSIDNLATPFPLEAVGFSTPFYLGQKMTAPFAVFFRLPFGALSRAYSIMAGCMGLPSGRPRLDAVLRTLCNPPPNYSQLLRGGLSLLHRIHTMPQNQSVLNPQTKAVSLFGVTDSLALKLKSRYPATIVKFSGFVGGVK